MLRISSLRLTIPYLQRPFCTGQQPATAPTHQSADRMRTTQRVVPRQQQHAVAQPSQAAAVGLEQRGKQAAGLAVVAQVVTPAAGVGGENG